MACQLSLIDPNCITVDGEIGRRFMLTIKRNLLQLNVDDFLAPFIERGSAIGPQGFGQYTGNRQTDRRKCALWPLLP